MIVQNLLSWALLRWMCFIHGQSMYIPKLLKGTLAGFSYVGHGLCMDYLIIYNIDSTLCNRGIFRGLNNCNPLRLWKHGPNFRFSIDYLFIDL